MADHPMRRNHLLIENIMKDYGGPEPALKSVSLDVSEGEFLALLGPSGCGKTTLLKIIAGLEEPTQGSMALAGEGLDTIPTYKRDIGIVFQSYALFPHMSVGCQHPLRPRHARHSGRGSRRACRRGAGPR